ncbi:hypothetical protein IEO21_08923 [Rhodonia placenta]|uniref:Peptidase A1 domain-containing protein n=1 Tax=Rhodonia placenta TaxID=104341 RepID=A0A8H7NV98_9APHY|nr:hypothetical protein IEO21_08923 [Postia placenta]
MLPTSLLSLLLSLAALVAADPIHIPLARRSNHARHTSLNRLAAKADRVRAKYGYPTVGSGFNKRATTGGLAMINQEADESYLGQVSVGTPPQDFLLILDTGSSDLWFSSTDCSGCPSDTPSFSTSASSTYKPNTSTEGISITYGTGSVDGVLGSDTVSMAGLTVAQQTFVLGLELGKDTLDQNVSGIMGLAWQGLASSDAVPWWQALVADGQLASSEMAFYLTRFNGDANALNLEPGGYFTIGGTNSSLFTGTIETHDILNSSDPTFWMITMSEVAVSGKSVDKPTGDSSAAVIDTGTSLLGGPSADVAAIYSAIPGSQALKGQNAGFYSLPCSATVDVSIAFGGQLWPISTEDMVVPAGENLCTGAIFDLDVGLNVTGGDVPAWIVGDTFLKNVYSVFRADPPSVGFAQLSSAAGGSGASIYCAAGHLSVLTFSNAYRIF